MAAIWFCLVLVTAALAAPKQSGYQSLYQDDFFPQPSEEKKPLIEEKQTSGEKQHSNEIHQINENHHQSVENKDIPNHLQNESQDKPLSNYLPGDKQQSNYFPAEKPQSNYFPNDNQHYYSSDKQQSNYYPAERPKPNNMFGEDSYYQFEHEVPEKPKQPSWYQPSYQRPQNQYNREQDKTSKPKRAESCRPEKCQPPNCRCSDVFLSRDIDESHIPQLVMLTFDDAVTALNYNYIKESMAELRNPDGCPVQATFFVSHEYTDYTKVHLLWAQGHEIALHSITHSPYTKYWRNADVETLVKEFGGQRHLMSHFANINIEDITGMRVPLFEMSGNNSFLAMKQIGLTYDSSWPTQHFISPGLWPYSLEYASVQDCPIGNCPTASIPNIWVNPILNWEDEEGHKCSMVDACPYAPEDDADILLNWMIGNFNRTYHTNRAPFGTYLHSSWFLKGDNHFEAYKRFLKYLNTIPDVYMVSNARVLEYVRNPKIGAPFDSCQKLHDPVCKERFCRLMKTDAKVERWMKSCTPCPAVYPWLGNPFGKAHRQENSKN